tara:strand:- start:1482 stop:2723 length:1242 start_codon:yes stop_codon:yes gene_type:complete
MKLLFENWNSYLEEAADPCWDGYKKVGMKKKGDKMVPNCVPLEEEVIEEDALDEKKKKKKKKKKAKRDACYHKVRSRYKVWPSAYASGALVKCRKVGAKNWGNKSKKNEQIELFEGEENLESKIRKALIEEGGAAGMKALKDHTKASEKEIKDAIKGMSDVGLHEDGDYILQDGEEIDVKKTLDEKKKKAGTESSKESSLRDWFGRKGAKGSKKGWVDCNAPDGKGGYKSCGRGSGEKRKKYPACRPTPGACKERGKGKSWGKKAKKTKKEGITMRSDELYGLIAEEVNRALLERDVFPHLTEAYLDDGTPVCVACLIEQLDTAACGCPDLVYEAEYRGRKVTLNKPTRGDVKKFKVYVKDPKTGNVKKVNFGDPNMKIRKSNPKARKSFRARHNCDNPGPKTKARYWSCKKW